MLFLELCDCVTGLICGVMAHVQLPRLNKYFKLDSALATRKSAV